MFGTTLLEDSLYHSNNGLGRQAHDQRAQAMAGPGDGLLTPAFPHFPGR